jgi:hypothetical protein
MIPSDDYQNCIEASIKNIDQGESKQSVFENMSKVFFDDKIRMFFFARKIASIKDKSSKHDRAYDILTLIIAGIMFFMSLMYAFFISFGRGPEIFLTILFIVNMYPTFVVILNHRNGVPGYVFFVTKMIAFFGMLIMATVLSVTIYALPIIVLYGISGWLSYVILSRYYAQSSFLDLRWPIFEKEAGGRRRYLVEPRPSKYSQVY